MRVPQGKTMVHWVGPVTEVGSLIWEVAAVARDDSGRLSMDDRYDLEILSEGSRHG